MFAGYKTYITAAMGVLAALAAYLTGEASLVEALQTAFVAVLAIFTRMGVNSAATKAVNNNVASAQTVTAANAQLTGDQLSKSING